MATTIIGKIGTVLKHAWSATDSTYNRLDEVTYQGSTYRVILENGFVPVGTLPTNTTYFEVSAQGVDLSKVAQKTQAKNLFNKNANLTTTPKLIPNTYRGLNGVDTSDNLYSVYGPISLLPGQSIASSNNGVDTGDGRFRFITVYKADGTVLEGSVGGTNTATDTFTMPAAVGGLFGSYVYVTLYNTAISGGLTQIERGLNVTTFEPYYSNGLVLDPSVNITPESIAVPGDTRYRRLVDKLDTDALSFVKKSLNLADKDDPLNVTGLFDASGNIVVSGNIIFNHIPVLPSTTYTISPRVRQIGYYGAAKNWISRNDANTTANYTFTTPSNVYFIRPIVSSTYLPSFLLQLGATATSYMPFGSVFSGVVGFEKQVTSNPITPLKMSNLGDSITNQNLWQPAVASALTLTATNLGVSGTKVAGSTSNSMWQDLRVDTIPLDTEILTILGGTNDWSQNIPLGTINSLDTNTFYGAYNVMLGKIIPKIPLAKIFLMGTTFGSYLPNGRTDQPGFTWASATVNAVGHSTNDYAEAVRLIANKWNLRFIATNNLGWNALNKTNYLSDEIHPSAVGGKLMAQEVINAMINRIR